MSSTEENLDAGSLQRKRTAWTTSVGHQRVSNDEINQRYIEFCSTDPSIVSAIYIQPINLKLLF